MARKKKDFQLTMELTWACHPIQTSCGGQSPSSLVSLHHHRQNRSSRRPQTAAWRCHRCTEQTSFYIISISSAYMTQTSAWNQNNSHSIIYPCDTRMTKWNMHMWKAYRPPSSEQLIIVLIFFEVLKFYFHSVLRGITCRLMSGHGCNSHWMSFK